MVFDSHLHEHAWVDMIQKYNEEATEEEIIHYIHGRTNDQIIPHFMGEFSAEELAKLSDEKELFYQKLVAQEEIDYVEGTTDLLDALLEREIPFTIATASPAINVDFYFDYFNLGNWFEREKIVHDDGSFPGKPAPAIYKKAADKLGFQPSECMVIEDALTGIEAANRAGIGKVIAMIYSEDQRQGIENSDLKVDASIENFNDFLTNHMSE